MATITEPAMKTTLIQVRTSLWPSRSPSRPPRKTMSSDAIRGMDSATSSLGEAHGANERPHRRRTVTFASGVPASPRVWS